MFTYSDWSCYWNRIEILSSSMHDQNTGWDDDGFHLLQTSSKIRFRNWKRYTSKMMKRIEIRENFSASLFLFLCLEQTPTCT